MSKVQLLWSRSAAYIHPSKHKQDNIRGFLSIVKSNNDILVSWVPESLIKLSSQDFESYIKVDIKSNAEFQQTEIFVDPPPSMSKGALARSTHAFAIKLSDLYSFQLREPALGWWYGSIILYPKQKTPILPIFFHDDESESERKRRLDMTEPDSSSSSSSTWGGQLFLNKLSELVKLVPSTLEKGLFLVSPSSEDKRAFTPQLVQKPTKDSKPSWSDVKWNLFEKLAQVTKFSRKAGQSVFDKTPAPIKTMLNIPEVEQIGHDFDSARVFLAEWALGIVQDQEETERQKLDVVWSDNSLDDDYSLVSQQSQVERRHAVTLDEWNSFFDKEDGRLMVTVNEVKERVFHGGLEPQVRPEAWLFLLNVFPWSSSKAERVSIASAKREEYLRLKRQWWEDLDRQTNDEFWKDQQNRIEKDVLRTDRNIDIFEQSDIPHPDPESRLASGGANPHLEQLRDMLITYNEYNQNLGYVQGMSDLLSPLYVVIQNDALAFAAFCGFMERMERNFMRSQEGMRDQLTTLGHLTSFMLPKLHTHLAKADSTHFFFFFRMILVWFKREFKWDDVLRLWEVLWTDFYSSQFHLFVALAILDLNKEVIMNRLHFFDEILKYINDLGMAMDLEAVLCRAEQLFSRFKLTVDLVDWQLKEGKNAPQITDDLRQLLSRDVVNQRETERPPGVGGG